MRSIYTKKVTFHFSDTREKESICTKKVTFLFFRYTEDVVVPRPVDDECAPTGGSKRAGDADNEMITHRVTKGDLAQILFKSTKTY